MNMRLFPILTAALALASCSQPENTTATVPDQQQPAAQQGVADQAPDTVHPAVANGEVVLHSLAGTGLKFNGVYDSHTDGDIHYIMRFFERGNVALVAGRQRTGDRVDLRDLLKQDAKSGKDNLHNVPVVRRGDSLFFATMATRGEILYSGVVVGDSVRFLKRSRVTGKKAVVSYGFVPDDSKWP